MGESTPIGDYEHLSLGEVIEAVWVRLESGAARADDPFHTPSVATVGAFGPAQRTVVLRQVDPAGRRVICHTDRRSAKTREVVADPAMSWHFYDRRSKLQIRLHGQGSLHTDDSLADACWARTAKRSKACYNIAHEPGQSTTQPPQAPSPPSDDAEERHARENFAAIACRVDFIDWLYLSSAGHRRAFIEYHEQRTAVTWVTP